MALYERTRYTYASGTREEEGYEAIRSLKYRIAESYAPRWK